MTNLISSPTSERLLEALQTTPQGLSGSLVRERLRLRPRKNGAESQWRKDLKILIRQFTNPLMILLLIAVILSAILGESSDSLIILLIILITGLLGFWQEANAGRAMEKLRSMIETKHSVLRDGGITSIPTDEVVPGDIILLDAGDMIPADCRILESNELHVNESSLTGESFPVEKKTGEIPEDAPLTQKTNCLWQGTNVISGTARAVAVLTGGSTIFGGMAHSLTQSIETSFERGMRRFGLFLLRITLILCAVILLVNLYFKKPLLDSVLFSLALAIGMAPELLPAVMTFSMSAGAKRMLRKKVIVKKLSAIFNFGEVNVLCTDKTGTLTQGTVTVHAITDLEGKPDDSLCMYAFLNASLQDGFSNPIDEAIAGLAVPADGWRKINEIPYDFIRKRLSVAVTDGNDTLLIMKGAFTNVMETCRFHGRSPSGAALMDDDMRERILADFGRYGREGYRVLGLAVKKLKDGRITREDETDMTLAGFILLQDPLKESALSSLQELESMGITVKIITGDNRYAAASVASALGLMEPGILTGEELQRLSPEALVVKAMGTDIFAEIEPNQKEQVVKALQKAGRTVAYMGDGINDVAAINAADIGISTNNAVDVAKDAADFVLLDKDLSVLADGIGEGRKSFANSMKYIFITTGATFGNMFSIAGTSLFLPFLPMLPKQILLNNLVSDLPFLTIASDRVEKEQLRRPGNWDLRMIRRFMVVFGIHSSLFDFLTFYLLYKVFDLTASQFQTGWFIESTITELLILFIIRTRKPVYQSRPGIWLLGSGIIALLITIALPYMPFADALGFSLIPSRLVAGLTLVLLAYLVTGDWLKQIFFRLNLKSSQGR
jgi:Mg2+-importing ATPase